MNRLEDAAIEAFARHETFHPRYGWFRKAVKSATNSPEVFSRDDAPVELGVGKNMVRAIRFWGKAAKVLADLDHSEHPRHALTFPSLNGMALLGDQPGLDPYLELPGSVWLLHWWMLAKKCHLPVWWITFNRFRAVEFSEDELYGVVLDELGRVPSWDLPAESSIRKDVNCLLRMYAPRVDGRYALDDLLDCPFRELGLLETVWDDSRRYRFVIGTKPTLPIEIVAYACIEFLSKSAPSAQTSTVSRLSASPGSPGRIFQLSEEALSHALENYGTMQEDVRLTSSAGVQQLTVDGDPRRLASEALRTYYRRAGHQAEGPIVLGERAAVLVSGFPKARNH